MNYNYFVSDAQPTVKEESTTVNLQESVYPASDLSYLGERSEQRGAEVRVFPPPPAFASPLVCLSRVYFSRYPWMESLLAG